MNKSAFLFFTFLSTGVTADISSLDDGLEISESIVFTPSRIEQHKRNVPAAVTVLTSDRLERLGVSSLAEAMRLVPGMRVNQASGWDYRINFHGTNSLLPRRMLVLVDGMSVYRYSFALVDWNRLFIDIEDIERIEVTRSPSGASYGPNAFQVVVNIKTKHPVDVPSLSVKAEQGSNGYERYYGRHGGNFGNTNYSLSVSKVADDGFDLVSFDNYKDPVPGAVDSSKLDRYFFRSETVFENNHKLDVNFGGVRADLEEEEADSEQLAPPVKEQEDWHAQFKYSATIGNHDIKSQLYIKEQNFNEHWRACRPAVVLMTELRDLALLNRNLALNVVNGNVIPGNNDQENAALNAFLVRLNELGADAYQPVCNLGNQDNYEITNGFEIEDTFSVTDNLRINTGVGVRDYENISETYTNGSVGSFHRYLFSNVESLLTEKLVLNAGFHYEEATNVEESVFNPRIGLNYHYTDSHTVRVAYSTGSRLPNILETDRNWNYYLREWDREFDGRREGYFFLNTSSTTELKPEKIDSFEIGFFGSAKDYTYDVRIFKEELTDLISEKGTFFDFNPTNNSEVELTGFEAELSYEVSADLRFNIGYSYLDNEFDNYYEQTAHSDHAGFADVTYTTSVGDFSLAYYGNSKLAEETYGRLDAVYSGRTGLGDNYLSYRFVVSYLENKEHGYEFRDDNRVIISYDDDFQFRAQIGISF